MIQKRWKTSSILNSYNPGVRLEAHHAVHKMRVATRRVRSALGTYRKLLDDADSVKFLRDELKWLAGVLGEARDAEVMHERLKDMVAQEPVELVMRPVTRRIDIELGADYQQAHAKVLEALDGQRYFHLLDALESMLATPPLAPLGSRPAHKLIPELVRRDAKRLRTAVREAEHHPAGSGDHPALHEARKTANACGMPPKRQPRQPRQGCPPGRCGPRRAENPRRPSGQRRLA